ncbi:MAG: Omp28-related outer membrane protein [Chitinophagaceae bacterium]|nr:Omp28-related outer membrane protein [Chitinophagaceae bacterium]
MKKIIFLGISGLLLGLHSCKEKDVVINMGLQEGITDSTYTTTVETAQLRKVLIEEFTGASCTNCPAGHEVVASLANSNPDRIVAIAYHTFNGGVTGGIFAPIDKKGVKSLYDFRNTEATNIGDVIFGGVSVIPAAGIDRIEVGTSMLASRPQWSNETNKRIAIASPLNMHMTSEYDATENKVNLKIVMAYTKAVSVKNILTIGVLESKIIDAQEFSDRIETEYEHNHVFRKALTPFNGLPVLDSVATKQAGRVYEFNYVFTPDATWNLDNCYIAAFVSNNDGDNKEVLQADEVKLK